MDKTIYQVDQNIIEQVQKYVEMVKSKHHVDSAFLFGSYSKGFQHKYSDVDVAIVTNEEIQDRHSLLVDLIKMAGNFNVFIEPHPMTIDELNDSSYALGKEVKKDGIRIS